MATADRWGARELGKAIERYLAARETDREPTPAWESPTEYELACLDLVQVIDEIVRARLRRV